MARRALGAARVRGDVAPTRSVAKAARPAPRGLDQATSFYERHLWETEAGAPVREYLESRGLGEEVCREFRLGLSRHRPRAEGAAEGFHAGRASRRRPHERSGQRLFPRRLMFPLADARGRIVGFQARKLHEDDPLRGKYVNSPEGELFHKSAILYGLHLARHAIAKQERGIVVEGNTDVIALRQAGLEPVVASMGTALTERRQGALAPHSASVSLLRCRCSRRGCDPSRHGARRGAGARCPRRHPSSWPGSRGCGGRVRRPVGRRRELRRLPRPARARACTRSADRPREGAGVPRGNSRLAGTPGSLAPRERPAWDDGSAAKRRFDDEGCARFRRVMDAGDRLERDVLAACIAFLLCTTPFGRSRGSLRQRAPPSPSRRDPGRRRGRGNRPCPRGAGRRRLIRGDRRGDRKELLLRLRERHLRRRLAEADLEETSELQQQLLEIRDAVSQLA